MSIRPHLVIDLRWRSLAAVVVTTDGEVVPCMQTIEGIGTTGWLSCDFLMKASLISPDSDLQRKIAMMIEPEEIESMSDLLTRLGIERPWLPTTDGQRSVLLRSPLRVLSTPAALADILGDATSWRFLSLLTAAQLEPIFQFLSRIGWATTALSVLVVVPASFSRAAALVLMQTLRHRGFRRLRLISNELAVVLNLLAEGLPSEVCIIEVEEDDLLCHRVVAETDRSQTRLMATGAQTVKGCGWSAWVQELTTALEHMGRLTATPKTAAEVELALLGLLGAPHVPIVAGKAPLRLSFGLLDEIGLSDRLAARLAEPMGLAFRRLALSEPLAWIGMGSVLLPGVLEHALRRATGSDQPTLETQHLGFERCLRGVVAALFWLAEAPGRRIELARAASIWLSTLEGRSLELAPSRALPGAPGQRRRLRQVARVGGAPEEGGKVPIHLLWGTSPDPAHGAPLCFASLEPYRVDDAGDPELGIFLDLCRSASGAPRGSVEIRLADAVHRARLAPPPFATSLTRRDVDAAKIGVARPAELIDTGACA